jgi:hypothetical protein
MKNLAKQSLLERIKKMYIPIHKEDLAPFSASGNGGRWWPRCKAENSSTNIKCNSTNMLMY